MQHEGQHQQAPAQQPAPDAQHALQPAAVLPQQPAPQQAVVPVQQPGPQQAPAPVRRLAQVLELAVEQLVLCSAVTLGIAMHGMSPADCGAVDVWLHGQRARASVPVREAKSSAVPDADALASHFAEEKLMKVYPFMRDRLKSEVHLRAAEQAIAAPDFLEVARQTYETKAKAGALDVTEAVILAHLLYRGSKGDTPGEEVLSSRMLAHLLLFGPQEDRLRHHNWLLARGLSESEVNSYGGAIEKLADAGIPLLPPHRTVLAGINLELLRSRNIPAGGSSGRDTRDKVFSAVPAFGKLQPRGGGTLPVVQTGEGWGVDVGVIEAAYAQHQRTIEGLKAELRSLKGEGRGRGRQSHSAQPQALQQPPQAQAHQGLPPASQQQQRYHQTATAPPAYGQTQPSYSRGRGRGRGAYGGDGEGAGSGPTELFQ